MIRLFLRTPMTAGGRLDLSADKVHYLTRVMRLSVGADILVFNGVDGEWRARLTGAARQDWSLVVQERTRAQTTGADLELIVALVKRPRLETIVEKACELGAASVRLVTTERTNADHANLSRLGLIAAEAAEQCERLEVPQILGPERLSDMLAAWQADRRLMFCDEAGEAPPVRTALTLAGAGPWAVLVGPEGGFSAAERQSLRALDLVAPVSLGPRILRADTAAIAALTLWQATLGDWGT